MDKELNIPSTEELGEKGQKIYAEIKSTVEPMKNGWYVAIEVKSQKYFVEETREKALEAAKNAFPDKLFYVTRIGGPARISLRFSQSHERILR